MGFMETLHKYVGHYIFVCSCISHIMAPPLVLRGKRTRGRNKAKGHQRHVNVEVQNPGGFFCALIPSNINPFPLWCQFPDATSEHCGDKSTQPVFPQDPDIAGSTWCISCQYYSTNSQWNQPLATMDGENCNLKRAHNCFWRGKKRG